MSAERVDYYSDEEFQQAQQAEIEHYRQYEEEENQKQLQNQYEDLLTNKNGDTNG